MNNVVDIVLTPKEWEYVHRKISLRLKYLNRLIYASVGKIRTVKQIGERREAERRKQEVEKLKTRFQNGSEDFRKILKKLSREEMI